MTIAYRCPECEGRLWRQKRCNSESCPRYREKINDPHIDTGGVVTVGELRDELGSMPDDALVAVEASGAWNFAYTVKEDRVDQADIPVVFLSESKPLFGEDSRD